MQNQDWSFYDQGSNQDPSSAFNQSPTSFSFNTPLFTFEQSPSLESSKKPRKKEIKPRSRHACDNCRSRRIKCDELKPRCTKCNLKNLHCTYTLKLQFKDDVESKGKRFGREGINSTSRITTDDLVLKSRRSHFQPIKNHSNLRYMNFYIRDIEQSQNPAYRLFPSLQPSIIPPDLICANNDKLNFALKYYVHFISPILNPVGDQCIKYNQNHNSGSIIVEKGLDLSSLIKYSSQNEYLFKFMMSLGSIYLGKYLENREWIIQSVAFQEEGLAKIKPMIMELMDDDTVQQFQTDSLLALMLLMLYELANDCSKKWIMYLRLCKKIVSSANFKIPTDSVEFSLLKFCLEFLDYQESMGRTACKDVNLFFTQLMEEIKAQEKTNKIELVSWMGCDKRLLPIIANITDLSFERSRKSMSETEYSSLCQDMKRQLDDDLKLEMIQHHLSQEPLNPQQIDIEEFCFLLSCEIKRIATILYLECCLMNSAPEDAIVEELVEQIFRLLNYIVLQNDYKWYSTLIWSTFMAASEISCISSNCENLRVMTLQIFDKLEQNTLGNIGKTKQIVIEIWKKRDMDNSDLHSVGYIDISSRRYKKRKKLMGFVNDWEKYVVDEKYAIALA